MLLALASTAAAQDTLSLEAAVAIALERNFDIRLVRYQRDTIDNNLTLGNANFLPRVSGNFLRSYTIQDVEQLFLDGRSNTLDNARSNVLAADVTLNWTIFDGLAMFTTYESLSEQRRFGQRNVRLAVEQALTDVTAAYYDVVQLGAQVRFLENTLDISAQRVRIAQAKYEVGTGNKTEYLTAQVDFNTDQSLLFRRQQALAAARVTLNELLARPGLTDFAAADTLIPLGDSLPRQTLADDAFVRNAGLQLAETQRNLTYFRTQLVRARRWPRVDVFAAYEFSRFNSQAGFLLQNRAIGPSYGLTATVNIFDGFNQNRREQNARVAEAMARTEYEQARVALDAELERTYLDYVNSLRLLRLEATNADLAEQSVGIALERYRTGVSTFLEFREVQRNAIEIQLRLIEVQYANKVLETELLRLSGRLVQPDERI